MSKKPRSSVRSLSSLLETVISIVIAIGIALRFGTLSILPFIFDIGLLLHLRHTTSSPEEVVRLQTSHVFSANALDAHALRFRLSEVLPDWTHGRVSARLLDVAPAHASADFD